MWGSALIPILQNKHMVLLLSVFGKKVELVPCAHTDNLTTWNSAVYLGSGPCMLCSKPALLISQMSSCQNLAVLPSGVGIQIPFMQVSPRPNEKDGARESLIRTKMKCLGASTQTQGLGSAPTSHNSAQLQVPNSDLQIRTVRFSKCSCPLLFFFLDDLCRQLHQTTARVRDLNACKIPFLKTISICSFGWAL